MDCNFRARSESTKIFRFMLNAAAIATQPDHAAIFLEFSIRLNRKGRFSHFYSRSYEYT